METKEDFICEHCQHSFHSGRALADHIRDRHEKLESLQREQESRLTMQKVKEQDEEKHRLAIEKKRRAKHMIIFFLVFLVIAGIIAGIYQISALSKERKEALKLEGVPSDPIHWHPHLTIIINGKTQSIPMDIGISSKVHYPIHTHETDGTVHMENNNPNSENVRLGYFFKVWGKTFSDECIFDFCKDQTHELKMYVNGEENKEYDNYIMRDKDDIKIEYLKIL
ncbi:MAG: hypothetical protein AABX12_05075 [Nanoarchaeota archaeon]